MGGSSGHWKQVVEKGDWLVCASDHKAWFCGTALPGNKQTGIKAQVGGVREGGGKANQRFVLHKDRA
jgi:hypothetical protein